MYRKYPLKASCNTTFTNGQAMPSGLITSIQISSVEDYLNLYISKIHTSKNFISVTVNRVEDEAVVCVFSGTVTKDFDVVQGTSSLSFISGNMTIGTLDVLHSLNKGSYYIRDKETDTGDYNNGLIEDSCIFCFTRPAVRSIKVKSKELVGELTTSVGENLRKETLSALETKLSVTNKMKVQANSEFSGGINSCPTPIIKKINTVYPDENGNIDIYGILPIIIDVASGSLGMASGLDLYDVCPERNKISPPENNSDTYYTDILTTEVPEWKQWPNFS